MNYFQGLIFIITQTSKLSVGAVHDFQKNNGYTLGVGMTGSLYSYPNELNEHYGSSPKSVLFFIRVKL